MRSNKEFKDGLAASERVAKLLMATGKLSGWVSFGQIVKAMGGQRQAAHEAVDTMMVYGWCKERQRHGKTIYGISTRTEVQVRNLEEMLLKYKNKSIIIEDLHKNTKKIKWISWKRDQLQEIKTYISTQWNSLERWVKSSFGVRLG